MADKNILRQCYFMKKFEPIHFSVEPGLLCYQLEKKRDLQISTYHFKAFQRFTI